MSWWKMLIGAVAEPLAKWAAKKLTADKTPDQEDAPPPPKRKKVGKAVQ